MSGGVGGRKNASGIRGRYHLSLSTLDVLTGRIFRWQKLRTAEVTFEKEIKEAALAKLTTREREVRKRIEDIIDPQAHTSNVVSVSKTTLKQHQPRSCNGTSQRRAVDGDVKKGKKKSSS